jgi:hypothetical protein
MIGNFMMQGYGRKIYASYYEIGQFRDNMLHGKGKKVYTNGRVEEGDWFKGRKVEDQGT